MSSWNEKLKKTEIPKDKYNNLTNKERQALYDLKNDKKYFIKGADKRSAIMVKNPAYPAVMVWNRKNYIKKAGIN